jgi:hypothetical protein
MRYIKLFKESNTDDYYKLIDMIEFNTSLNQSTININDNTVNKVENQMLRKKSLHKRGIGNIITSSYSINKVIVKQSHEENRHQECNLFGISISIINSSLVEFYLLIIELEDEWFLMRIRRNDDMVYYKCDQLEGLLKCIDDYEVS